LVCVPDDTRHRGSECEPADAELRLAACDNFLTPYCRRRRRTALRLQYGKRLLYVGNQFLRIFQPDVETHQSPRMLPAITHGFDVVRDAQADRPAPTVADLE